jgi:phosphoglycolate phosphatase-like HAD superfamily hydrolase
VPAASSMSHNIEAVVFDVDGTLLDTREFISQAYEYVLHHHGMPSRTREEIATQIGRKIEDCYAFLAPGGNYAQMIEDHHNFQAANIALVTAFDHVELTLDAVRRRGLKTALWTGRKGNVIASLEHARVKPDVFDTIVDSSMHTKGKPDPEGLFLVLDRLAVRPENAVMVGDAGLDIEAGRRAKVAATIGITHGFGTKEELEAAGAHYIIDSIDRVSGIIYELGVKAHEPQVS